MREFALAHLARGERIVPSVSTIRIIRTIHIGNRKTEPRPHAHRFGWDRLLLIYSFGLFGYRPACDDLLATTHKHMSTCSSRHRHTAEHP